MTYWEKYKKWINDNINVMKGFMFRGQSNPDWKLTTTFHRTGSTDINDYINQILPIMSDRFETYDKKARNLKDPVELGAFLALLQHNGFPTPLLDWTLSPYIAAYFAFEGASLYKRNVEKVRIFAFCHTAWQTYYTQSLDLGYQGPHVSIFQPFIKGNIKYLIQQGIFMLTNVYDIESHIYKHKKDSIDFLVKFDIPIDEKTFVMKELKLMGISSMSLFPSIEGICKGSKEEFYNI